ncbi:MAG: hypothetical protein KDA96_09680 [Planctomycetaceae bacterium]|nr:hypothetical protein [Planctomycetaceae bacterium]
MALKHKEEYFTRWTHVENGQVLNRRLHRIEVQANDGRLYVITGDRLPDFIQTCTGAGHKGTHLAQILFNPGRHPSSLRLTDPAPWPSSRDVLMAVIGVMSFIFLRYALRLIGLA